MTAVLRGQGTSTATASASSLPITLDAATQDGDVIVVVASGFSSCDSNGVSGLGATWSRVAQAHAGADDCDIWVGKNPTAGQTSLTVTFSSSSRTSAVALCFGGLDSTATIQSNTANVAGSTTTASAPSVTPTVPSVVICGIGTEQGNVNSITSWSGTPSSGWSSVLQMTNGFERTEVVYNLAAAAGVAHSGTMTYSTNANGATGGAVTIAIPINTSLGLPSETDTVQALTPAYPNAYRTGFTGSDSAAALPSPWLPRVGVWGISSNTAYCPTLTPYGIATVQTYRTDASVQVKLSTITSCGLALRWDPAANSGLGGGYVIGPASSGGVATLYKVTDGTAGTTTSLGTTTATFANGDVLRVEMTGNAFAIYKNGVLDSTINDSSYAGTEHGLWASSTAARFDDFSCSRKLGGMISRGGYSAKVIATSPIIYAKLDDGAGASAADHSGNSRTGTYGTTTARPTPYPGWIPGETEGAQRFDGGDQLYWADDAAFDVTTAWTMMAIVKQDTQGTQCLWARDSGTDRSFQWQINSTGKLVFSKLSGTTATLTSAASVSKNRVYHLAVTYDGTTIRQYINGVVDANTASTNSMAAATSRLTFGFTDRSGPTNYLNGAAEKVSFHSTCLSAAQIAELASIVAANGPSAVETDTTLRLIDNLGPVVETDHARALLRMRGTTIYGPASEIYYASPDSITFVTPGELFTMLGDGSDASYAQINHTDDSYYDTRHWLRSELPATQAGTTVAVRLACNSYGGAKTSIDVELTCRRVSDNFYMDDFPVVSFTGTTGFTTYGIDLTSGSYAAQTLAALAAGDLELQVHAIQNGGSLGDDWSFQVSELYLVGGTPWDPNLASAGPVSETDTVFPIIGRKSLHQAPEEIAQVFSITPVKAFNDAYANRDDLTEEGPGSFPMNASMELAHTESGEYTGAVTKTLWYSWTAPTVNCPTWVGLGTSWAGQTSSGGAALRVYYGTGPTIPGEINLLAGDVGSGASGSLFQSFAPIPGNTYSIQVGVNEAGGTVTPLTFELAWDDPATDDYDFFSPVIPSL